MNFLHLSNYGVRNDSRGNIRHVEAYNSPDELVTLLKNKKSYQKTIVCVCECDCSSVCSMYTTPEEMLGKVNRYSNI